MNNNVYVHPKTKMNLKYIDVDGEKHLKNQDGAFCVKNDVVNFLDSEEITGLNKKYESFYNKVGYLAGGIEKVFDKIIDFEKMREEWLLDIDINKGDKVLEVSVGTGWNIKALPKEAEYFGLDISQGMIHRCVKNLKRWERTAELCIGNGEDLPYKDDSFDVVFHIGGINFFNDRKRALEEMVRVAKKGTKIVVIDETEKDITEKYQKTPIVKHFFKDKDMDRERLKAPIDLLPDNVECVEEKLIDNGTMYQLSFIKK